MKCGDRSREALEVRNATLELALYNVAESWFVVAENMYDAGGGAREFGGFERRGEIRNCSGRFVNKQRNVARWWGGEILVLMD